MRARSWGRFAIAAIAATGVLSVAAPVAGAADIIAPQHDPPQVDDGWQAGTCTSDTPECSIATPAQFFRQGAGHPPVGFTQFTVRQAENGFPIGNIHNLLVDLPVGLSVNPQATPQCPLETFESGPASCPPGSQVGMSFVTISAQLLPLLPAITLPPAPPLTAVPVYNIEPPPGEPARFGFQVAGNNVYLKAGVAWWDDYHEFFTIDAPRAADLPLLSDIPGLPLDSLARLLENRLVFNGRSGNGTFITTPSTCLDPDQPPNESIYSTFLRADSYEEPDPSFPDNSPLIESPLPPGEMPIGCDQVPFEPSIEVDPGSERTDSPAAARVDVRVPFDPAAELANSNVETTTVKLPAGMGLNPAAAEELVACTDAQFGKGTKAPVACPRGSRVGEVAIETPVLPPGSISGEAYVGQPLSDDPASGKQFRLFVHGESERYGVSVRLIGEVSADPQTGELTATFDRLPQVPFSSFEVRLDGGDGAVLTTPATCGPHETTTRIVPYSAPGQPASPSAGFELTSAPGGGECAATLAARPFAPSFATEAVGRRAASPTRFVLRTARADGEQELAGIETTLPPGLSAVLRGVPYCPEEAIAAAAARRGVAEQASPSCPAESRIGTATVAAGVGNGPLIRGGNVYLAGPYKGAPLSLAIIVPAVAGPYDLGTVVTRAAIAVDPATAQVTVRSDPLPQVVGGVPLHLRSVEVDVDREGFLRNPTNCNPLAVGGTLIGAQGASTEHSDGFQVSGCDGLGFGPRLRTRIAGGRKATRRSRNPGLVSTLQVPTGGPAQANIARASVRLPKVLLLDQDSISHVCTRPQFAAGECPPESVYGRARAVSPLLDEPLSGPVYLRSSDNLLPDLVADLSGQVRIELVGRVDSARGAIRTNFETVPDVPVSSFTLRLTGGRGGLLVNSRNLCRGKTKRARKFERRARKLARAAKRATGSRASALRKRARRARRQARRHHKVYRSQVRFEAHNGAATRQRPKLVTRCGPKRGKGARRGRGRP